MNACSRQPMPSQVNEGVIQQAAVSTFQPSRTPPEDPSKHHLYLMDRVGKNTLVRGSCPCNEQGKFDGEILRRDVESFLKAQGERLPSSYRVLDLTLMNSISDYKMLGSEKQWFKAHPEAGELWIYPLYGSNLDPLRFTPERRTKIIKTDDIDGLKPLMRQLHQAVQTQHTTPYLIYLHCKAGKDRTGEAAACYLMQFKGFSYQEVVALDAWIAEREVHPQKLNAIRWYAFYLRDVLKLSTVGSIEGL